MNMPSRIVPILLLASTLLPLAACSGSSGGSGAAPSLGAPQGNSPVGNWLVDGSSIQVIADTGTPHDIRDGDAFRIGLSGMVVFAGTNVTATGAIAQFLLHAGAGYTITGTTLADRFQTTIRTDLGLANGKPANTDYITIECSGQVVNGKLVVQLLGLIFEAGQETDRDELAFTCSPGTAIDPNVAGTWLTSNIRVVSDTGTPHDFSIGDETVVPGAAVAVLTDEPIDLASVRAALGAEFDIDFYYNVAGQGLLQGSIVGTGRTGTSAAGDSLVLVFDLIRFGDRLQGNIFVVEVENAVENIDDVDVMMNQKTTPARLPELPGDVEPARNRKLMTFAVDMARAITRR